MLTHPVSRRRALTAALTGPALLAHCAAAPAAPDDKSLVGTWTYRSFINDPDPNVPFNDLQFAVADLTFDDAPFGQVAGRLSFGSDYLKLRGAASYGNPFALRFQGVGATAGTIEDGKPWVYDYVGYLVPDWPNGVNQRPAIVGSVIRTVPHSQGQAKAGFVASFIAVRRTQPPPPAQDPVAVLRDLETKWAAAVVTNDPAKIAPFLSDDFLFVGTGGVLQTRDQHLGDFRTGKLKVASVKVNDATIHPYTSGAAVSMRADVRGSYDGRDISGPYRFLDAWLLTRETWQCVARQQTRVAAL